MNSRVSGQCLYTMPRSKYNETRCLVGKPGGLISRVVLISSGFNRGTSLYNLICFKFMGLYRNHSVLTSVCPYIYFCKYNTSFTTGLILVKLKTVAVPDLRMCMKEDNSSPNQFQGRS